MRIRCGDLCRLFGLVFILSTPAVCAESDGEADLGRAIEAKLSANTAAEFGVVIDLCQSALDKGLEQDRATFCKELLVATLLQRAETTSELASDIAPPAAEWAAAIKDVERAAELDPQGPEPKLLLGKLLIRKGDPDEARRALDQAIRLAKDDFDIKVEALQLRVGLGDFDDSVKCLSEAIDSAVTGPDAPTLVPLLLRLRGDLYLRRNVADKALADFDAVIALEGDDTAIHYSRALALEALKRFDEARESYSYIVKQMPGQVFPLLLRARASYLAGDYQQVLEDATRVLEIDPDEPFGLMSRASALAATGRHREALQDVNRALALQPGSTDFIGIWAMVTQAAGKSKSAIKELHQRVEADPEDADAWLQLGLLYAAQRRMGKAIDALGEVVELQQHRAFALHRRGDIYLELGMRTEAIASYEEALRFDQDNGGVLNNLAWTLATAPEQELRDGKRALELALKACELTSYAQAHILSTLAAAYAECGDFEAARTWSQKSLDAGDDTLKEQLRKELASYERDEPVRDSGNASANGEQDEGEAED
jgi:tetratricopeptide (TPR) repeat protein